MMGKEIPVWAAKRACDLTNVHATYENEWKPSHIPDYSALEALARYIAEHEQPSVDLLLIEAREIVAKWWDEKSSFPGRGAKYRNGCFDDHDEISQALAALRRGIELAKEQDA